MKIVYLLDDFPPKIYSSASMIVLDLAKNLLELGHEISIITRTDNKKDQGEKNYQGIKIFRIYSKYPLLLRHWFAIFNPQIVFKVKRILKNVNSDICHFHHIHQYLSYYCLKIAKKYSKKVFITAHDVMFFHYGKLIPKDENFCYKISIFDQIKEAGKSYNPFRNYFIKYLLKNADKIFAVSNSLKNILEINKIKNIEVIYNGIDVKNYFSSIKDINFFVKKHKLNDKKVIIFVARLIEAKGGDQLLDALRLVKKKFSGFVLLIIGQRWAYTEKLEKMAEEFNIKENILFLGQLNKEDLKIAYNSADLSVSPSVCFETFGMVNLEAMACKKPVVSSCFGGFKEVVLDNKTGYLINPNNIELMAEKILDLLKNPQKSKKFGEVGHERVKEKFSLNNQIKKTLENYLKQS